LGRSRGGLTTKLHLAGEAGQRPLSLLVTAGQAGDSPPFEAVLEAIRVPRTGRGRPRLWLPGTAAEIEDVAAAERAAGLRAEAERTASACFRPMASRPQESRSHRLDGRS
jgi:hypothetical protein